MSDQDRTNAYTDKANGLAPPKNPSPDYISAYKQAGKK